MDIDFLAKMIKEVVMDHDSVTLPGMGSFVAELVPATFTDRGYTILPPYRRLYFSPKQGEDRLLLDLYARSNPEMPHADAARILEEFIAEMKDVLKERKTLVLTGLGRLRATRENHFFFVADEDLDIYPAGYGLQPISLKTHEETPEEVAAAVSNLAEMLEAEPEGDPSSPAAPQDDKGEAPQEDVVEEHQEDVVEAPQEDSCHSERSEESPVAEPEEMPDQVGHDESAAAPEPVAEPEPAPAPKKKSHKGWKVFGRIILWLLILAVLAAAAVAVVGRMAPEWLDRFLYSAEELEILHQ